MKFNVLFTSSAKNQYISAEHVHSSVRLKLNQIQNRQQSLIMPSDASSTCTLPSGHDMLSIACIRENAEKINPKTVECHCRNMQGGTRSEGLMRQADMGHRLVG